MNKLKQNKLLLPLYYILLPFKPILIFFMYVSLGVYYSMYGLIYPFILLYNVLSSSLYNIYKNSKKEKDIAEIKETVNLNIDEKMHANAKRDKELAKIEKAKKQENAKKLNAKLELEKQQLLSELDKTENIRSEKPITFKYTARNSDGKKVTGIFSAYSKTEVFNYLEGENYNVYKIETNKLIEFMYGNQQFLTKKMSTKDLIFWLTQLSTYLKSGITLTDSMKILSKQMGKNDINKKRIFDSIIYNLTLGESFSDALDKQNNTFPPLLVNMIKAAEATGELEQTLDDMAEYYTETEQTRKQMISALTYP